LRLVIDGRRLTPERTGVGRYLEMLLAEWAVTGLPLAETVVVLKDPGGAGRVPGAEGLRTVVVGSGWPGLVWERWGLGRVLRAGDILFAPTNLVPSCWRGRTVLVLFDAIQEVRPEGFSPIVRWRFGGRYRRAAGRADVVIVPSEATARDAERIYGVPRERLRVVYPGIDPGFRPLGPDAEELLAAREALGLSERRYFLFVGKRSHRRNVPAILAAFASHRRRYPGDQLVFAGQKRGDGLESDGDRGIRVEGHVSESVLRGLMAGALGLLYPSEYEGFGLPVAEAMASGCPVITLRNSALTEAGGDAAYYLDSASPEALAEGMDRLRADEALRSELRDKGLAQASRFGLGAFAESIKAELRDAASVNAGWCGPTAPFKATTEPQDARGR
jgi:glycosyltransferase involved in cell wall biosynthesis